MARTAPVPNIPPIPGMCPSVLVAGGGSDSGGSGGQGAGSGGSGGPGSGGGAADGTGADGKAAGVCGAGGPAACTNCGHNIAKGDPVDVTSGRVFTIPAVEMMLPGYFNLEFLRAYSSEDRKIDKGIGFGWSHSLAWTLEEHRDHVVVRSGDGARVTMPKPEIGEQVREGGWGLFRGTDSYLVRPGDEFIHRFEAREPGSEHYLLKEVTFRNRGSIKLDYERGHLRYAYDTAGRTIVFELDPAGRAKSISVPDDKGSSITFARYTYDENGNLIAATNAEGATTRFAYDDGHRLLRLEYASGLVFTFIYDDEGRCVETWGAYPHGDPALLPDLPEFLADGETKARGIYHAKLTFGLDGYSEAVDSVQLQRFFEGPNGTVSKAIDGRGGVTTREYDEVGHIIGATDPTGATWTYEYDALDKLIREVDPEGNEVLIERDGGGRAINFTDAAGGFIENETDSYGEVITVIDQREAVTRFERNDRGLVLRVFDDRGGRVKYDYDQRANCVAITSATGGVIQFEYDYWGRCLSERDPLGRVRRFTYSAGGQMLSAVDALGRSTFFTYDMMGNLIRETGPDGTSEVVEYGGLNWRTKRTHADGSENRVLYNREGWPITITNERGEVFTFERSRNGLPMVERDFVGRETKYGRDALGRVTSFDDGNGPIDMTLNKLGQVVEEEAFDGSKRSYQYDARGELIRAMSDSVSFEWERDEAGNIIKEIFDIRGQRYEVATVRDSVGDRVASKTSLGLDLTVTRDLSGLVAEMRADGETVAKFNRDPMGAPLRRELPGGAAIESTYDEEYRLRRRRLETGVEQAGRFEPDWVGARKGTVDRTYEYTLVDEVRSVSSADGSSVEYEYDLGKHVRKAFRNKNLEATFDVDAAGNYSESGGDARGRVYGQGSKLLSYGNVSCVYNASGYLIEKRLTTSAGVEVTRFEWSGWGLLKAVVSPDKTRIEFDYDPFARRLAKRVVREGKEVENHHYVWDLVSMVHDVDARSDNTKVSTYVYENNDEVIPIAQREGSEWLYYVHDVAGVPSELVDGRGRVASKMERNLFGAARVSGTAPIPFRLQGQTADQETGLHYNRYRYFDPEIGRFISPDPISIGGGFNLYAYGPNTLAWIDPNGWKTHMLRVEGFPDDKATYQTKKKSGPNKGKMVYDSETARNCPPPLSHGNDHMGHSEQKFAYDLIKSGRKGGHYQLTGTLPPCPNCHAAMMRAAAQSESTITYGWKGKDGTDNNTVTYGGAGGPQYVGKSANALREGYSQTTLTTDPSKFVLRETKGADVEDYWGMNKVDGTTKAAYKAAKLESPGGDELEANNAVDREKRKARRERKKARDAKAAEDAKKAEDAKNAGGGGG